MKFIKKLPNGTKNVIKKNFNSSNILQIGAFSLIFIPLFLFGMKVAGISSTDRFVFSGLILMATSLVSQFCLNTFRKAKAINFQYSFILIVLNITMFLSYILKYHTNGIDQIEAVKYKGAGSLLSALVISGILFAIKIIIGFLLVIKRKQLKNKEDKNKTLVKNHSRLEEEHDSLKEKFNELKSQSESTNNNGSSSTKSKGKKS